MLRIVLALSWTLILSACLIEDSYEDTPAPRVSSEEISISGGQIQSTDNRLTLTFPDGVLAASTEISILQLTEEEIEERYPDIEDTDFVYELGPDGYTFLQPIEVTYLLPSDANNNQPRALISASGGVLESLSDVVYNPETGEITGLLSHFSDVLAVAWNTSFDYPETIENIVNTPPLEFTATASAGGAQGLNVDTIGGDASFAPVTTSGTDRYITINSYSAEINNYDTAGPAATGSATISFSCNEAGIDGIRYRFIWTDEKLAQFDELIQGSVDLETEVTCLATVTEPDEEEPPLPILTSVIVDTGNAPEAIKKAGSPPYTFSPEDTVQRFLVSGTNLLTIVNALGVVIDTFELFVETYGTLYLQHSTSGDHYFAYGPEGRALCPMEEGAFCQVDIPTGSNTTSAEYGVDANGNEVFNEVYRVRGGEVMLTEEQDQFWQEENFFDNEVVNPSTGLTFNATVPFLFAYEPLTPSIGVGITENGTGVFIDNNAQTVTEFSDSLGAGLRDIECAQFSPGEYGCAIQSFTDATITPCGGSSAEDFSCGEFVSAGDGVSLGVAVSDQGNLIVAGADFTDSSIHIVEFTPEFETGLKLEFPLSTWLQVTGEVGFVFSLLGHAEIDPESDAILVSGNGSDNAAILSIDELAELDIGGASGMTVWFN